MLRCGPRRPALEEDEAATVTNGDLAEIMATAGGAREAGDAAARDALFTRSTTSSTGSRSRTSGATAAC